MKLPDAFKIPPAEFPDGNKIIEKLLRVQEAMRAEQHGSGEVRCSIPPDVVKAMADIATHVWKARSRMMDPASGEVREEMKRV